jgi:hypothetical protein
MMFARSIWKFMREQPWYKDKFDQFAMKKDESVSNVFNRMYVIMNELTDLGYDVLSQVSYVIS